MRFRSPFATAVKLAYVGGMVLMVSAGTLNTIVPKVKDAPLDGVEVTAERPRVSLATIRSEEAQQGATAWFEQHWGLRGYAVKTDNTLVLGVFGEARAGQAVVMHDAVLISEEDLTYVNRADGPEDSIAGAKTVARVQKKLLAKGKVLVPIIIPAKTSFFREEVPSSWRRRGSFALADTNVYGTFVRALSDNGALFVDGRAMLAREMRRKEQVFTPTGRHWRSSAGCRTLQAAIDVARPYLPELGAEQIDCHVRIDANPPPDAEDYDLFRLLNIWTPRPRNIEVEALDGAHASAGLKIPTIFVGSSFVWKFVRVSHELGALQPSLFYYYDSTVVETSTMLITKKVEPNTDDWRADTMSKRLFIVGMLETYIPGDGQRFVLELEKEMDQEDAQP